MLGRSPCTRSSTPSTGRWTPCTTWTPARSAAGRSSSPDTPGNSHNRRLRGAHSMYEKNGEKYFVVDSHMHFWDASRDNWVEGRENLAKGWIDCFYGYHKLAPEA